MSIYINFKKKRAKNKVYKIPYSKLEVSYLDEILAYYYINSRSKKINLKMLN